MERQFKGIWIPAEIWETRELSWNEKVVLLEIDSFTASGRDCFISDEYIGNLVGVNERTARRILSKLISLGYVKKARFDGRRRYIESTLTDHIVLSARTQMSYQGGQNCPDTNNHITNNNLQKKEEIHKEERFRKPSFNEVSDYCTERRNGIDPQTFIDFYDSKGWKVGNTPMKDWRAAIRTWESKRKNEPLPRNSAAPSPKKPLTQKPDFYKQPEKESLVDYYRRVLGEINGTDNGTATDTPDEQ